MQRVCASAGAGQRAGLRRRAARPSSRQAHGGHRLRGDALAAAGEAQPFRRRRLDADAVVPTGPSSRADAGAHGRAVRADLRAPRRSASGRRSRCGRPCRRPGWRRAAGTGAESAPRPLRVAGRKVRADVAGRDRAQQRVGQSRAAPTSASLCPDKPLSCGMSTPPSHNSSPASSRWTSKPDALRVSQAIVALRPRRSPADSVTLVEHRIALHQSDAPAKRAAPSAHRRWPLHRRASRHGQARSAGRRKPCGVCTRNSPSRGTTEPSRIASVSATARTGDRPLIGIERGQISGRSPAPARRAVPHRGPAPCRPAIAASPRATDSRRVAPPTIVRTGAECGGRQRLLPPRRSPPPPRRPPCARHSAA